MNKHKTELLNIQTGAVAAGAYDSDTGPHSVAPSPVPQKHHIEAEGGCYQDHRQA